MTKRVVQRLQYLSGGEMLSSNSQKDMTKEHGHGTSPSRPCNAQTIMETQHTLTEALEYEHEGFIEVVVLAKLTGPNDCRLHWGGTASQVMCNLILTIMAKQLLQSLIKCCLKKAWHVLRAAQRAAALMGSIRLHTGEV